MFNTNLDKTLDNCGDVCIINIMERTLEQQQKLLVQREQAVRLYFENGIKNFSEIARLVGTSRQNVNGWIKVELRKRKKK